MHLGLMSLMPSLKLPMVHNATSCMWINNLPCGGFFLDSHLFLLVMLFLFSRTSKVTLKHPGNGPFTLTASYVISDSHPLPKLHVCTMAFSVIMMYFFSARLMISPLQPVSLPIFNHVCELIDKHLHQSMKCFGLLQHYNGVNTNLATTSLFQPVPTSNSPSYHTFNVELIWPMLTCHPDIAFPLIKLSQFSNAPANIHYTAAKCIFRYLSGTLDQGVTYWRPAPLTSLDASVPLVCTSPDTTVPDHPPAHLLDYHDSDWAMDIHHHRSISGIVFMLSGGAIAGNFCTMFNPLCPSTAVLQSFIFQPPVYGRREE